MTELPSGTVTFLFTDVEGSTRLWGECQIIGVSELVQEAGVGFVFGEATSV